LKPKAIHHRTKTKGERRCVQKNFLKCSKLLNWVEKNWSEKKIEAVRRFRTLRTDTGLPRKQPHGAAEAVGSAIRSEVPRSREKVGRGGGLGKSPKKKGTPQSSRNE